MIIGITGTNGAGKGAVVKYLVERKGYVAYSVRNVLETVLRDSGIECNRSELRAQANSLRAVHGPDFLVRTILEEARRNGEENIVVESVRTVGEATYLKNSGGLLLAVDAERTIRFNRIQSRKSSTDHIDFDTFVIQEDRELSGSEGDHDMNVTAVMKMADHTIMNNGTLSELHSEIDRLFHG